MAAAPAPFAGDVQFALTQGLRTTLVSPMIVVRTLIQCGYEPVVEYADKNFLGQKGWRRLGLFEYCRRVYNAAGIRGLFLGWQPRFLEAFVNSLTRNILGKHLWPVIGPAGLTEQAKETGIVSPNVLAHEIAFDTACGCTAVALSHPLYVIGSRMIAEYVGREGIYATLVGSVGHIYNTEGLAGFYAGVVPALLQETAYVVTITLLTQTTRRLVHAIMQSLEPELQEGVNPNTKAILALGIHNSALTLASPIFYPFFVVKTMMAINGPELALGRGPYAPKFASWTDAYKYLRSVDGYGPRGLLRGNAIVRRFFGKHVEL